MKRSAQKRACSRDREPTARSVRVRHYSIMCQFRREGAGRYLHEEAVEDGAVLAVVVEPVAQALVHRRERRVRAPHNALARGGEGRRGEGGRAAGKAAKPAREGGTARGGGTRGTDRGCRGTHVEARTPSLTPSALPPLSPGAGRSGGAGHSFGRTGRGARRGTWSHGRWIRGRRGGGSSSHGCRGG